MCCVAHKHYISDASGRDIYSHTKVLESTKQGIQCRLFREGKENCYDYKGGG